MKFLRIKENGLFRKAYKSGKRKGSHTLTVFVLRDRAAEFLRKSHPEHVIVNRLGISASKKVGGAVQRNRAKRVIREAYREIDKTYGIKKGFLIVITPRPECTVKKMQSVKNDLLYCLRSLDMIGISDENN